VPVKFLSEAWNGEVKERLVASEAFRKAAGSASAKIQQVITGPDGERRYWIKLQSGEVDMGQGDVGSPDCTITQDYDTAVAMAKSEINPVSAFMSGKLKVSGNMMLLMQLQGAISELGRVMDEMDVDY
jgi:putative sterol carrier protein